jgi:hypothetical protein
MVQKKLIERGWRSYAEHVLPTNAGRAQIQEMRRAFYAGAGLLFEALTDAVGPDDVSEDAGMDIMRGVDEEIRAFVQDVAKGRK